MPKTKQGGRSAAIAPTYVPQEVVKMVKRHTHEEEKGKERVIKLLDRVHCALFNELEGGLICMHAAFRLCLSFCIVPATSGPVSQLEGRFVGEQEA